MALDIGKSFKFMFDDQEWLKKIAIGGVLNIIPIVNLIPIGYGLRTLRNVADGRDVPLPEWDDWGGDFVRGLMAGLVAPFIYSLPIIVLSAVSALVAAIVGNGGSQTGDPIAGLCVSVVSCLSVLFGILISVILPAAIIKYSDTDEFAAFFRFGEIWQFIRENLSDYIIAILLILVAFTAASIVGGIACGIGVLFTTFWATLVSAHLLGQVRAGAGTIEPTTYTPPVDYTGAEL
ncbi:MAG: DUF4013 domain-containing protein [Anaerolineae bacterium]